MDPIRRLKFALASILGVAIFGTVGYWLLGWDLLDALYMTVITVTTVGYREVGQMDRSAMVFTMVLLGLGFGTVFYSFSVLIESLVAGQIGLFFGRKRVQKRIDATRGHHVICGFGRMGRIVCRELANEHLPFVVMDADEHAIEEAEEAGYLALRADATDEDSLGSAGIERAAGLVAVLSSDADNLYVILCARAMNPKLKIIARADQERSEQKLLRAGADRVVAPYLIGGARIAQALLRPSVLDFVEIATCRTRMDLLMEETQVSERSRLCGKTVRDSSIRSELGLIIVAVKRPSGDMQFNPPADLRFEAGDVLLALGERASLQRLARLANP